jgi:hypothetical protein
MAVLDDKAVEGLSQLRRHQTEWFSLHAFHTINRFAKLFLLYK